jgi:hypothetical protein
MELSEWRYEGWVISWNSTILTQTCRRLFLAGPAAIFAGQLQFLRVITVTAKAKSLKHNP